MMLKVLLVACGGALGAVSRAGLAVLAQRALGPRFPWGTLAVNLIGCFLFGLVWALVEGRERHADEIRFFALTGFMGSFTTFSTFAFDTVQLGQLSRTAAVLGNLTSHNALGVLCLLLGLAAGRAV
jgi:CrcB protein